MILVIPSHLSEEQGEIALAGAATPNSSEGASTCCAGALEDDLQLPEDEARDRLLRSRTLAWRASSTRSAIESTTRVGR